jgi:tetratricopeptide (TPR) repeat protein
VKPLCFILMPFGKKPAGGGLTVDFDAVYESLIKPAVEAAGLEPLRADEEIAGGIIHKPMFERLVLCEYAVADLTTANANVFYELGLRHAVRPWATQLLFAEGLGQLPFDVAMLRALPYKLGSDGKPVDVAASCTALTKRLQEAKHANTDSPVFQLLDGFPDIQRLKTDVFRERVRYAEEIKTKLATARKLDRNAVHQVEQELGDISHAEAGVVIDLFLSYRAVEAWDNMIALVARMAPPLAETVMVLEQLGLALNRAGRGEEAERVLLELIARRGPSSETYGILGRVYKDRWKAATKVGNPPLARGLLNKAIDAYLKGFEADWRDAYPGINAVSLMELKDPPDPRQKKLLPVVAFAVEQRIVQGKPDYWDYATLIELAVLAKDQAAAESALADALAHVREIWEPKSTAHNLRLICDARALRGEEADWVEMIEKALLGKA